MSNISPAFQNMRILAGAVVMLAYNIGAPLEKKSNAAEPAAAKSPGRFEKEIVAFEKRDAQNAVPSDPVLFVGSSSVRLWQTAHAFPDLPVINRGFGGSTISDVNHYFDRIVAKYEPSVIVFYSGDNDIAGGKSEQRVVDDFRQFFDRLKTELPDTHVLVLSIKPSIARAKQWKKMQAVNAAIEKLAGEEPNLEYIDIATPMLAESNPPPKELFLDDGLHLNRTGYNLWNKALQPRLADAYSKTTSGR